MGRQRGTLVLVLAAALAGGCAGGNSGRNGSTVPDRVMLTAADFGGEVRPGGPTGDAHPLPPRPCAPPDAPSGGPVSPAPSGSPSPSGGPVSPAPSGVPGERWISATDGQHQAYEYVAYRPAGAASAAFEDLMHVVTVCSAAAPNGDRYRVVARYAAGALVEREYGEGGDRTAAYFLGYATDYLVVVLEVGTRLPAGDLTYVNGLGMRALERAGGGAGDPLPTGGTTPTPTWTTFQAEVTAVRRGPDPRTALIDVQVPGGGPDCARDPRVDQYIEENGHIYANVVVSSAAAQIVGGCPNRASATVTLTAPGPLGDRLLVLNQQAWVRAGDAYRRCEGTASCGGPPVDRCDPGLINTLRAGLDVPRNSAYTVEHCADRWLVLTVNVNSTACGAGGRPGCTSPPLRNRYFLRFDASWQVVAQTRTGGCAAVLAVEPAFPRQACENLPALG